MITTDDRALKFYQVPRHDDDGLLLVLPRPRHGDIVAPAHVPDPHWKLGPLNLISLGSGVPHVDPPDGNHGVLAHGDVVGPDHLLLELHLLVIIKEHQHEILKLLFG